MRAETCAWWRRRTLGEKLWIIGLTSAVNLLWPVSVSGGALEYDASKSEQMSVAVIRGVLAVAIGVGVKSLGWDGIGAAALIYGVASAADGLVVGCGKNF